MSESLSVGDTFFVYFFISIKRQPDFPMWVNIIRVVFFFSDFSPLIMWIMKNHKVLLKMNWFGTPLPIISSSQGFHRVLSRCSPFFIDISRAWAQKNVIEERKKWRAAGLLLPGGSQPSLFLLQFPSDPAGDGFLPAC